jgi:hypothetical protein
MMKTRDRRTGAVEATMRQQFACSAFGSRTSFLFGAIGDAAIGVAKIPGRAGSDKCRVLCILARVLFSKDNGDIHLIND